MKKKLMKWGIGLVVVIASMSFVDGYFQISKNIEVFSALYKEVNNYYVDEVDPSKMMRTCIDGMLTTLDPYTNYFGESQIESARIQQGGKFGGIGIDFIIIDDYPVVSGVTKGQPADKMGVQTGDVIKSLDGNNTKGRNADEINKILVGQPNTPLHLELERKVTLAESKMLNLTVNREEIQETSVPFYGMVTPEIACIKLKIFNEGAGRDVKEAFDSLKRANPAMKGVILDLRGNPGGLLNEAVNIVNIFVDKDNLVVTTKGKVEDWNKTFETLNEPSDTKIPVVVLANSMSASASEIVSGCMQDYDRGVIVGQKTYGKGLVQVTKNLSYNTMLKVTTAKYYIPSGRCVQAINYAERNPDGSVKHVPDSLKRAFKTKNGRQVWDGGGVDPDVAMPKMEMSKVATALLKDNLIFAYASQYKLTHPTITDAAAFKLSDAEFNEFLAFVKSKNFTYKTESEEKLEKLKETAEEEKYFDAVKTQYEAIKAKLNHDKQQDMVKQKTEIVNLLEGEIVGRYYYVYGKIKKNYQNDTEVAKAVDLIMHPEDYNEQLMAKK